MTKRIDTVREYIASQPAAARPVLTRVRAVLRKALPGAVESIAYRIPTYKVDGRMVLYFAGFARHYAVYPATAGVRALGAQVEAHLHGKGTLRFALDEKVPVALLTRIAKLRAREARERSAVAATRRARR